MSRRRLDTLVAERGLAPTRSAAATSIRAGLVRVGTGGAKALKPGQMFAPDVELSIEEGRTYVSRGGLKLEAALESLGVDPTGARCLDIGSSTGGFTDCLLRRGAVHVTAVDVGRGQLDWTLRNDERVTAIEGFNARELTSGDLPYAPDLVTIDVSFISLAKVIAPLTPLLAPGGRVLAMVKPQFELGRGRVGRGGVVRDPAERREAVMSVIAAAGEHGLGAQGVAAAGVPGPKGNREIFVLLGEGPGLDAIEAAVEAETA